MSSIILRGERQSSSPSPTSCPSHKHACGGRPVWSPSTVMVTIVCCHRPWSVCWARYPRGVEKKELSGQWDIWETFPFHVMAIWAVPGPICESLQRTAECCGSRARDLEGGWGKEDALPPTPHHAVPMFMHGGIFRVTWWLGSGALERAEILPPAFHWLTTRNFTWEKHFRLGQLSIKRWRWSDNTLNFAVRRSGQSAGFLWGRGTRSI